MQDNLVFDCILVQNFENDSLKLSKRCFLKDEVDEEKGIPSLEYKDIPEQRAYPRKRESKIISESARVQALRVLTG